MRGAFNLRRFDIMLNALNRLKSSGSKRTDRARESGRTSDLPLDRRLSFTPSRDERWNYDDGAILLNDMDVKEVVRECSNEVGVLCGVSEGLNEYQHFVWSKGGKEYAAFNGVVDAVQHTIQGRLTNLFDGLTGGVHFEWMGEDFWINNVNVRSVVKLYALRPTQAAKCYLEGLRDKVGLILSRRQASTRYDAVYEEAQSLYEEIDHVLNTVSPASVPCLSA